MNLTLIFAYGFFFIMGCIITGIVSFIIHKRLTYKLIEDLQKEFQEIDDRVEEENDESEIIKNVLENFFEEKGIPKEAIKVVKIGEAEIDLKNNKNSIINAVNDFYDISDIEKFKESIQTILNETVKGEDYIKSAYLRDLKDNCQDWFTLRKQWFLDNIGRTIFLKNSMCTCNSCTVLKEEGVLLDSEKKAMSFFGYENIYKIKGDNKSFYTK